MCGCLSRTSPTGDLACNPGMCPDWGSNLQPFGLQASTQSTEPHQPGRKTHFKDRKTEAQRGKAISLKSQAKRTQLYATCPSFNRAYLQLKCVWGAAGPPALVPPDSLGFHFLICEHVAHQSGGRPTFWRLWATPEEKLSWATH